VPNRLPLASAIRPAAGLVPLVLSGSTVVVVKKRDILFLPQHIERRHIHKATRDLFQMSNKQNHELLVFSQFIKSADLLVHEHSVEAREPPEPDIWCLLCNKPYYFELGRILSSEEPKLRLEMIRRHPQPAIFNVLRFGLPMRDVLRRKLKKTYETNGVPVDLILYYDWGPDALVTASAPFDESAEHFQRVLQPELLSNRGPFATVWIYERYRPSGSVLWRHPASSPP